MSTDSDTAPKPVDASADALEAEVDAPAKEAGTGAEDTPENASVDAQEPTPEEVLAQAQEKHVRLYAEFENYKKRTSRENEDFKKYANESLLRELLGVLDNLERAISHAREAEGGGETLQEGVEMTHKLFIDTLEKFGVTPIPAAGEVFNPAVHQAVSQVEAKAVADGAIAEVFRTGFFFKERVLRPAMVVVAKNK